MSIKPAGNRVLCIVRDAAKEQPTIITPETKANSWLEPYGDVIAVGPDVRAFSVGDRILFNPAHAMTFSHEGQTVWMVDASNIMGTYQ